MRELKLAERLNLIISQRQPNLFHEILPDLKERIKKLDSHTLKTLYLFSLSDSERVYDDIFYFLEKFEPSLNPYSNILNDRIFERIFSLAQKVRREIHRFKGFMRFKEVEGGYLYGAFFPEYNIIMPLSRHFATRLVEEKLIIHDTKRNLATFCFRGRVYEAKIEREIPNPTEIERMMSELWLRYFRDIAVRERENRKLQKQKVPLKYRSSILEFHQSLNKKE